VTKIYLLRRINKVFKVRTPTTAYNNALSYQLSYVRGQKGEVYCNISVFFYKNCNISVKDTFGLNFCLFLPFLAYFITSMILL